MSYFFKFPGLVYIENPESKSEIWMRAWSIREILLYRKPDRNDLFVLCE